MKPVITKKFSRILIMGSAFVTPFLSEILKRIGGPVERIVHGAAIMLAISMTVIAWKTIRYINKNINQTDKEPTQEK